MVGSNGEEREIYVPKNVSNEQLYEKTICAGINFQEYLNKPVKVNGENMLAIIYTFNIISLHLLIIDNIKKSTYE